MFTPHHTVLRAPERSTYAAWVLHGILGSGKNLRSFAQSLSRHYPEWDLILVDLRCHGDSTGAPPPHTVRACAEDLLRLGEQLPVRPTVALGHSFGGKVALRWAQLAEAAGQAVQKVWVLDASPSPVPSADALDSEVVQVLRAVRAVPQPLPSRAALEALLKAQGFSGMLAGWMTTNLRQTPDGLRWRFDLDGIEALLRDYAAEDLWPWLHDPARRAAVAVVAGDRSTRWTPAERARFPLRDQRLALHPLAEAGHWVHVDNPRGLVQCIVKEGLDS